MSSRSKHWTQSVAEELRAELGDMADATRMVFKDLRPKPQKPNPKAQLAQFLQMPREQRQQMYAEMGPEEYNKFIDQQMETLYKTAGPAASVLMPYLYADGITQDQTMTAEQEAQAMLQQLLIPGGADQVLEEELFGDGEHS